MMQKIWYRYLKILITIEEDDDLTQIGHEIKHSVLFKGANFWAMVFAIIIACIGLNIGSKLAIIGAMILSPLMGPVYGISFGIIAQDSFLIKNATKNFLKIILISLFVSSIYFVITPLDLKSIEVDNFTSASIFDILIAFFGGIAGFIAISRKNGERFLVGVSIATSCIPPICASGYGISHGNFGLFFGGLYLFLINAFFIFLGSFMISLFMNIHKGRHFSKTFKWVLIICILVITLPSIFHTNNTIKHVLFEQRAIQFVEKIEQEKNLYILEKKIDKEHDVLHILYYGHFPKSILSSSFLDKFYLDSTQLVLIKIK
jgi:uncharacterized hydrophobic protein (TIGR00271 family)